MSEIDITGTWNGYYEYGETYRFPLQGRRTFFTLIINEINGEIFGQCIDDLKGREENLHATIKGFINGFQISFIKQYPFRTFIKESGERVIVENETHPEIEYQGQYNVSDQSFSGEWSMVIATDILDIKGENKVGELFHSGTWMMNKI